jgi:hypothetical protein
VEERLDANTLGIKLILLGYVEKIAQAAVVICVAVRCQHRIQFDGRFAIVLGKLPINKICGVLPSVLKRARKPAIHHDVAKCGRFDKDAIALPDVYEVEFKQRLTSQLALGDETLPSTPRPYTLSRATFRAAVEADTVAP